MPSVRSLTTADLTRCGFAGSPLHLRCVAAELTRAEEGEVDYLVVVDDDGRPVAIGGVDHVGHPGESSLFQLSTDPERWSQGFGTRLVRALEDATRRRGRTRVRLDVEVDNPRARSLYERLGYRATGVTSPEEWDSEDEHGRVTRYRTQVLELVHDLGPTGPATSPTR